MDTEGELSVLLIEDDEIDAEDVRRSLPRQVTLHHCSTLRDAIESLGNESLDLVLLDPGLPDSSGIHSFLSIHHAAPQIPIVVLTGLADEELALQIIRLGAQDYLVKNKLDDRSVQALYFAVERGRLLHRLEREQAERERLATELRTQEQSMAHLGRVALMGELVAEISHEVSQPLSVISTLTAALELSLMQEPFDREQSTALTQKLIEANSHAGDILHRLREFIRNDSIQFEPFDINELIVSTTEFIDFERRQKSIAINHKFSDEPLMVMGNSTQIRQVIVNLLRNAFDAMKETIEPERQVTTRTYRHRGTVVVEIADRGPGLELDQESAFSAFTTTKSHGLGMGLAICTRILNNHGGKISTIPGVQPGAVFQFELPSA